MNLPLFKKHKKTMVAALKGNLKKAMGSMRDTKGGRCCLCVIQDSLCKNEEEGKRLTDRNYATLDREGIAHKIFEDSIPYFPVLNLPKGRYSIEVVRWAASSLNDGNDIMTPLPHKLIAECVNNIGMKYPKWSFYYDHARIIELPKAMTLKQANQHAAKVLAK